MDAEFQQLIGYSARRYGKIPINELTAPALKQEMELSNQEADAIVAYRNSQGGSKASKICKERLASTLLSSLTTIVLFIESAVGALSQQLASLSSKTKVPSERRI